MRDTLQAVPAELIASESGQAFAKRKQAPQAADPRGDYSVDTISSHRMDIGRHSLLTHQEEIDLAKQINEGKHAYNQLTQATDPAEKLQLEQEISRGIEARHTLWEGNYGLVISIAKRYIGKGLPFDDLVQEGNLGLEHAISKYDFRNG